MKLKRVRERESKLGRHEMKEIVRTREREYMYVVYVACLFFSSVS